MGRVSPENRYSARIHSGLEPKDYERLAALAEREKTSISQIVRLAVIAFLNRRAGGERRA